MKFVWLIDAQENFVVYSGKQMKVSERNIQLFIFKECGIYNYSCPLKTALYYKNLLLLFESEIFQSCTP